MALTKVTPNVATGFATVDANGEVVEKPVGAAAALPTDVLHADGTFSTDALGVGQTWQDVTASRVVGTTYTNTTGRPIKVSYRGFGANSNIEFYIDGLIVQSDSDSVPNVSMSVTEIVPSGSTYMINNVGTPVTLSWFELR